MAVAEKTAAFVPRPELLLHPNIPKPLHGLAPRTIKGQEWWDRERQIAYAKTDFRCAACGVSKQEALYHQWLEAHEWYDIDYRAGTMTLVEIVALCHACHNFIHSGRMRMMVANGEMAKGKMEAILRHGESLLSAAGLRPALPPSLMAEWDEWRLVIDGEAYGPSTANPGEWNRRYSQNIGRGQRG